MLNGLYIHTLSPTLSLTLSLSLPFPSLASLSMYVHIYIYIPPRTLFPLAGAQRFLPLSLLIPSSLHLHLLSFPFLSPLFKDNHAIRKYALTHMPTCMLNTHLHAQCSPQLTCLLACSAPLPIPPSGSKCVCTEATPSPESTPRPVVA